jgi:UDP-glucose 4-epimerase
MRDSDDQAPLAGARVLVTGARGFLGGNLCARLAAEGAKVTAVSRVEQSDTAAGVQWCRCDVEDFAQAEQLVRHVEPDVIFHLGGRVSAAPDVDFVLPTFHSLLTSTANLLTLATRRACHRVVLVGSLEEPHGEVAEEATPTSPYGAAKWAAGAYGRMFHRLYGCPVVSVRPFMTYGPGQAIDKIIPSTILSLLRGEPPRLSSARRPLDWVYVDDVIEGMVRAATARGVEGTMIDLGSGTAVPGRDVVERLVALIDPSIAPLFGALPDRPAAGVRVANLASACALLGWQPTTSLEAGLRKTIDWYRTHHFEYVR